MIIDYDVECEMCGGALSAEWNNSRHVIEVSPCSSCIKDAEERGDEQGYERGMKEGGEGEGE